MVWLVLSLMGFASVAQAEEDLYSMINKQRQKGARCGNVYYPPVAKLSVNQKLWEASGAHVSDMIRLDFFSHTSPSGKGPYDRIKKTGYFSSCRGYAYAENIAAGQKSEREVFKGWMNSPGHCKNIMNPHVTEFAYFHTIGMPISSAKYSSYSVIKFASCR